MSTLVSGLLHVGIVGCGHWGRNYVRVLNECPQALVKCVADKLPKNLDFVRKKYPRTRVTDDARRIADDASIDAVIIAAPAAAHVQLCEMMLANGKHVLVEKPLALSPADASRLCDVAAAGRLTVMVGHTFLYNASVQQLRELVQEEKTGRIYYATARRTHLGLIRSDVSSLWDLAVHDISIFSYVLAERPITVAAVGRAFLSEQQEDIVFVTLEFPSGALATITASWMDAVKTREVVIVGERRRFRFDDVDQTVSLQVIEKGVSKSAEEPGYSFHNGDQMTFAPSGTEPLKALVAEFIQCVVSGKRPLADDREALAVVRVLAAADASLRQGGVRVAVDETCANKRP